MDYKTLSQNSQLDEIDADSHSKLQVIFKHSTRCSVSRMAKRTLDGELENSKEKVDIYYLDLLSFIDVSSNVSSRYGVHHESPQILIIKNGKCIYQASHSDVLIAEAFQHLAV